MIVGLSPMDGVTDGAFRYMVAKYGHLDVMFTEFVSVDALHYATGERRERLLKTLMRVGEVALRVSPLKSDIGTLRERPFKYPYEVAQVFGKTPELFAEAVELIGKLGFDGIDINMGCPAARIEEQGSGAGLIRTPKLAQEIISVVKKATKLPVSVKTRIGIDQDVAEEWMEALMEVEPAVISLHGRTLKQLYQGMADWEAIGRAGRIVHKYGGYILGNGDIGSVAEGMDKVKQYGVDGFLIGRAAEGNPGIFLQGSVLCNVCGLQRTDPCKHRRLAWAVEHAKIYEKVLGMGNFMPMRKHLAWYCRGFPRAVELRMKLMQCNSSKEVKELIKPDRD